MKPLSKRPYVLALTLCLAAFSPALGVPESFDSGGTTLQHRFLEDADRSAYHGRFTEAVAKVSKVVAESPNYADAIYFRAGLLAESGRYGGAEADLDRVALIHPDSVDIAILRAEIAIRQRNAQAALAQFATAMSLPGSDVWARTRHYNSYSKVSSFFAYRSIAQQLAGHDAAALGDLKLAVDREYLRPWYVLIRHCYVAAVAGLLNMAELTCQEAADRSTHDIGQYDNLGFVHLKMKAWSKALADYNKALSFRPDMTLSLYGRGVARRALGDKAGGDADMAAAIHDEPDIANIMARLGAPAA